MNQVAPTHHNREADNKPAGQAVHAEVIAAVNSVDDPEYPGLSIADLGLVEAIDITKAEAPDESGGMMVSVGLVPTFSGCPALSVIAADVTNAVMAVDGVDDVTVRWLADPVWTTERVSPAGLAALADDFTVAVEIGATTPTCPRCGSPLIQTSMFGPSRCRAVARCAACSETVEVMRA